MQHKICFSILTVPVTMLIFGAIIGSLFLARGTHAQAIMKITSDHHHHHHHLHDHSHLRRLNSALPPPGQCKNGEPMYTIGGTTYSCKADFTAKGGNCKTVDQTEEEKAQAQANFHWWKEQKAQGKGQGQNNAKDFSNRRLQSENGCGFADCVNWDTTTVIIPVAFHIFHSGNDGKKFTCRKTMGSEKYTSPHEESDCTFIQQQIQVLNDGFAGIKLDNIETEHNANTNIQFCLASANEKEDPKEYDNTDYYQDTDDAYKATFHVGKMETLNVWISTSGGGLGYARFPSSAYSDDDGVVILNESTPNGGAGDYEEGDTLTHEVGHWLGLYHTHQGGCKGKYSVGDYMGEAGGVSSKESRPTYGCPASVDNCRKDGGPNPFHNYMSYSDDTCMDEFTPGQAMEMQSAWELYRHRIGESEKWSVARDGFTCVQSSVQGPTPTPPAPTPPTPTPPVTTQKPTSCDGPKELGNCGSGDPRSCCSGQCHENGRWVNTCK